MIAENAKIEGQVKIAEKMGILHITVLKEEAARTGGMAKIDEIQKIGEREHITGCPITKEMQ